MTDDRVVRSTSHHRGLDGRGLASYVPSPTSKSAEPGKLSVRMLILYAWIVIGSLIGIQDNFPVYSSLHLRELITVILIGALALSKHSRKHIKLWRSVSLVVLYAVLTVARSSNYDTSTKFRLFVHIIQLMLLVVAIPVFVHSLRDARRLFLFVLSFCAVVSLSAPLQGFIGPISWLTQDNWEWIYGRVGFARYLSVFGDPNVAAMIAGVLPLSLLAWRDHKLPAFRSIIRDLIVWAISFLVVAYSLSFTGIILLVVSSVVVILLDRQHRFGTVISLSLIAILALYVVPNVGDRFNGIIQRFSKPADSIYSLLTTHLAADKLSSFGTTHLAADLEFRLLEYLNLNNTLDKVLIGSTYNVVTPGGYLNPSAVLAHNSYKEIYLAGGLVGLAVYLLLFAQTGRKAFWLIMNRKGAPESIRGTIAGASFIYLFLLLVMLTFPVYHYVGIGTVFWCTAGLIHLIYDKGWVLCRNPTPVLTDK